MYYLVLPKIDPIQFTYESPGGIFVLMHITTVPDGWQDRWDCRTMILVTVGIHHPRKYDGAVMKSKYDDNGENLRKIGM